MKKVLIIVFMVTCFLPAYAHAIILDVTVDADLNSISPIYYDSFSTPSYSSAPFNTGLFLNPGDHLEISASGIWSNAPISYNLNFGPNGNSNENIALGYPGAGYPVAALMGRIGNNSYFFIGSNYSNQVSQSGTLYLGFNDTDYGNNRGVVTAHITDTQVVPEPATCLLLGVGGLCMTFLRRHRS